MKFKSIAALTLSLALAGSMTGAALAAEDAPLLIAGNPNAYRYTITVNGETVDTTNVPNVDGLPFRLVAEADHGSASWYESENSSFFNMTGGMFTVDYADNSVSVMDEKVEGVTATVAEGVTFLPLSFFQGLEGVEVTFNEETNAVDIVTPNNDPLIKTAYALADLSGMRGMVINTENVEMNTGITADHFADNTLTGFGPMMISPDTLLIGKVAEGKLDSLKEGLEAYRANKEETFTWYLTQHLEKVQDARVETEGEYFLFYIGESADEVVTAFHDTFKAEEA